MENNKKEKNANDIVIKSENKNIRRIKHESYSTKNIMHFFSGINNRREHSNSTYIKSKAKITRNIVLNK